MIPSKIRDQDNNATIILVASHGKEGVKALIISNETHKVLPHSKIPVMVDW